MGNVACVVRTRGNLHSSRIKDTLLVTLER